ncbi:MAG: PEGA domain-containing protein, partial [Thermodesulfovibrionia bacterium]|nr:PEGA domain-containing protein [Thermodesulfovibrionia bacterium]
MKRIQQVILLLIFTLSLLLIKANLLEAQERASLFIDNMMTNVVEKDLLKSLNDHLISHIVNSAKFNLYTRDMHETSKADLTVKGSLVKIGDNYIINLRLIDNHQNKTINTIREKRRGEDLLTGIENASFKLLGLSVPLGVPVHTKGSPTIMTPPVVAPITGGKVPLVLPEIESVPALTGFGFLYIKSEPSGASLFLNDENAGHTPRSLEMLEAGKYKVRIVREGYFPWEDEAIVAGGSLIRLNAKMKTIYGSITFDSTPQDAEVYINGNYQGQTPLEVGKLEGGAYGVEIKRLGYEPMSDAVQVKAGEITTISEKIIEKADYKEFRLTREKRKKKQLWAWGSLITGGLLAGKAFTDYSDSNDAYSDSDAAFAAYLQSTDSAEIASFRALAISKGEEGDKKKSDGNAALIISAAIAALSS